MGATQYCKAGDRSVAADALATRRPGLEPGLTDRDRSGGRSAAPGRSSLDKAEKVESNRSVKAQAAMPAQACSGCGLVKARTREFFGSTPSGGLRLRCRLCVRAYCKQYGESHRGAQAARNTKRAERGGHINLDASTRVAMWRRQKHLCLCCGERIEDARLAKVDHAVPVAKGGTHEQSNLFLAHPQCNAEKHAKTLDEHWAWRAKVGLGGKRPTRRRGAL